ncbi:MAG TPA: VOC family protein [Actinomycetota bacterium]|jgi:predicted enzyme related to lactoylglutathione lyase|nr:VOC family protein [Actinomycetota bacterium]
MPTLAGIRNPPYRGNPAVGHDGLVTLLGSLIYLYVGSDDVPSDVAFYRDHLGAEVVWHHRAMGTEVAAVRLGEGPLVLLADHREAPSILPIWSVEDIDAAQEALERSGWSGPADRVEVPDGPCLLLRDSSGNQIGLLQQVRPGVMDHR